MQCLARLRHRSSSKKGILQLLAAADFHTGIRTQLTLSHFFEMDDVNFGRLPIYSRHQRPHIANLDGLKLKIDIPFCLLFLLHYLYYYLDIYCIIGTFLNAP